MYNWKKWIWPGVITSVILTAGTAFIKKEPIEGELSSGAASELKSKHGWASVDISGRDITLKGKAPNEAAVEEANKLAKDVYGVRVVKDATDLIGIVKPYTLAAEKKDGKLVVSGFAPNAEERANILEAAKQNSGGLEVVDKLELARGNPDNVSAVNTYAIGALSGLATGSAKISDTSISVSGAANKVPDYQGTLDYLKNVPSGMEVASQDIKPATVSPYTLDVVKKDGNISLEGFVPSFEARSSVGEKFTSSNPNATVENNLKIALGSPDGVDWNRAASGFPNVLGMLEHGSISVNDKDVTYEGKLPKGGTLDAFNTAIRNDDFSGLNIAGLSIIEPPVEVEEEEAPSAPAIPTVEPYVWSIDKQEGKVIVTGNVTSDDERASTLEGVKSAFAGNEIEDKQTLGLGKPDGYDAARAAIAKGLKFLDTGTGTISANSINVVGIAKNNNIKGLASKLITKAAPQGYDVNLNISSPDSTSVSAGTVEYVEAPVIPTIDPYVWGVLKTEDNVIVTGNVTSDEERASVLDAVKSAIGSNVNDQQTLGLGKPDGLDAVRTGVSKGLKFLETGSARVSGDSIIVTGAAKNNNVKKLATNILLKNVPYDYKLDIAIRAPASTEVTAGDVKYVVRTPTRPPEPAVCAADVAKLIDGQVIQFETNSSDFLPQSEDLVTQLAARLNECTEISILVEGHTDSRGSAAYNQRLSDDRSSKVKAFLVEAGIKASRITAKGFSETKPIATNKTPEGRAQNRRTLISIIK